MQAHTNRQEIFIYSPIKISTKDSAEVKVRESGERHSLVSEESKLTTITGKSEEGFLLPASKRPGFR